jgi:pimeloyl-ACP methyl ester carboxylesterase
VPRWYGPRRHPAIPLVISPHGRGIPARASARLWGSLPALGGFAVVSPDGQGRRLALYSWGYRGQIDDLARMPRIVRSALPWLRIDASRVYAIGGSMGGQEVLLLLAQHPRLLAGVAAFDAATDLAARYAAFTRMRCNRRCLQLWQEPIGIGLRRLAREEVGGSPADVPRAYALRSPIAYTRSVARSGVPLQIWWSVADEIVNDGRRQSRRFYTEVHRLNPKAPVVEFVGRWQHSRELRSTSKVRVALARFGLLAPGLAAKPCRMTADRQGRLMTRPDVPPALSCLSLLLWSVVGSW